MLSSFFGSMCIISFFAMIAGLIRPSWVKVKSKRQSLGIYGITCLACFIGLMVVVSPAKKEESGQNKMQQTAQKRATGFESQFRSDQVLPYDVVFIKDTSIPGRTRVSSSILINSRNATYEQKAQTIFKAASDIAKSKNADVVTVSIDMTKLTAGSGYQLALCQYAPDGGGFSGKQNWTCKITASEDNPTAEQLKVLDEWYYHRYKFQKDGMTDETKLKKYLAKSMGLPEDKITLPYVAQTAYYSN